MSTNNIIEQSFKTPYLHGLYKTKAHVTGHVVINMDTREFRIDVTKGHDTMGYGSVENLPKMIATLDMKQEMINYLNENL
jgi:hypothetical protein